MVVSFSYWSLFRYSVLGVLSRFAFNSLRKRELVALLYRVHTGKFE